ncbi:MAG: ABC transporter permease [Candidatus Heimdallarchaeota archaeon]|nr:MAG: ABC transporter permease [Candidatus Heimdallarchaeota archaeon]
MENEETAGKFTKIKMILVLAITVGSGVYGFFLPGNLALASSIKLGPGSVETPIVLLIGTIFSFIVIGLGIWKDQEYRIGTYLTIQSKHLLIMGSVLFLITSFTFNGLDILGFFVYYYEIALIALYTFISIFGFTLIIPFSSTIKNFLSEFGIHSPIPTRVSFNFPCVILAIFGVIFLILGILLVIKKSGLKIGRQIIPAKHSSNLLILGVVFCLSTIFLASLYQPTYVQEPGVIIEDINIGGIDVGEITYKNLTHQPMMEFNITEDTRYREYNAEYAIHGLVDENGTVLIPPGVVVNESILITIHRIPMGPSITRAVSDFYLDLVIYLYPLVIFIGSLILLKYSSNWPKDPEPFISKSVIESMEGFLPLIKRIVRMICISLGILTAILFAILTIEWLAGLDTILNLTFQIPQLTPTGNLIQHATGLFLLSLILLGITYLPKVVRPFLDGRVIRYSARRVLALIPIFIGVSIISYSLMIATGSPIYIIMSRQPVTGPGRETLLRDLMRVYGLNSPPQAQWFNWFFHFIMGDLGNSIHTGTLVIEDIGQRIMPTLEISIIPLLLTIIISIPLGIYASLRQYSWKDNTISIFVAVGLAMPIFLLILLLILTFAYYIPILPPGTRSAAWVNAQDDQLLYVFLFKDTFIQNVFDWKTWDLFFHLIIPVCAITMISLALYTRLVRSGYLEVLRQDYILSAQAYGFDEKTIIFKHSLKNVLIPLVTFIGLSIGGLLGGAPITETTLTWPGLGRFAVQSIQGYDYPVVMGLIMTTSLLILLANLLTDILYSIIDPRVIL